MKRIFCLSVMLLVSYKIIITTSGCAQMVPPTGGPRDSLPPVLLGAVPKDSTLNFTGKKIVLEFDEFINLDKPDQEVIVSPVPKVMPLIEAKLRNITITIKDTLEENTTYSIDFGRSLKDLNEGNPFKNFTYLFSTGSYIDSTSLGGKVVLAETGKIDSTLIVMLHRNFEDSVVAKEKPRYYTRLDSAGLFHFSNIAPGKYNLFALKDAGGQKMYMNGGDLFAFYDNMIAMGEDSISPVLYAFTEKTDPTTGRGAGRSGATPAKSTAKDKKLSYQTNLETGQQDLLSDLVFRFSDSLVSFDDTKFLFTDTLFTPVDGYTVEADTSGKVITVKYPWKEEEYFKIILEQDIAKDSAGHGLAKTDTISFVTKKKSDYGSLRIRMPNLDTAQHIVLLIFKGDKLERSLPATGKDLRFDLFPPGEYEIRLLYDRNGNNEWDTGNYWEKRQPEKIVTIPKKNNIRANWDNEITIELPEAEPPDVLSR
ncbi:MAG: Ig-like domain-containing protein [Chitinophagaceae bacterium]|nr:Ig-like domain-containing protein [Chitinophagaceae bacterium]MCW5928707.1 Ig-like domain-containing protein [Chitinophagaceae bacterium]